MKSFSFTINVFFNKMEIITFESGKLFNNIVEKNILFLAVKNLPSGLYRVKISRNGVEKDIAMFYKEGIDNNWWTFSNILYMKDRKIFTDDNYTQWYLTNKNPFNIFIVSDYDEIQYSWSARILVVNRNETVFIPRFLDYVEETNVLSECLTTSEKACPIDADTQQPMTICLNWRRTDYVGKECRENFSKSDLEKKSLNFCIENKYAQDCKCINRYLNPNFNKNDNKKDPYCWYPYCQQDANYLHEKSIDYEKDCLETAPTTSSTPSTNNNTTTSSKDDQSTFEKTFNEFLFFFEKYQIYILAVLVLLLILKTANRR